MAGFRGVADTATDVKVKQDQMAQQEELARLQVAASMATANANRDENARQFNITTSQQKANLAEGARRYDAGLAQQAEDTAWARSQEEKKTAEEQRRFGLTQQATERGEQRAERQLSLDEFRTQLAQRRDERMDAREDISTQMASAQLQQYLAATEEEKQEFLRLEPAAEPYFYRWVGADEFINGHVRWCLWLAECPQESLRRMPHVKKRVDAVGALRAASKSVPTQKIATTPTRFHVINRPGESFLVVPGVSSETRPYNPMGFLTPDVLVSNLVNIVPGATLYHFG
ncbi:MAG: hypothetical protein EOM69_10815, partial [Clostridia bacterium]|nr:hypothetical protein [Clostridia bacterium]